MGILNYTTTVAGVEQTITRQQKRGTLPNQARYRGTEHAARVAWRILKDWVAAQLAMIEAGLVTLDEVMLPYMVKAGGVTIIDAYRGSAEARAAIEGSG